MLLCVLRVDFNVLFGRRRVERNVAKNFNAITYKLNLYADIFALKQCLLTPQPIVKLQ